MSKETVKIPDIGGAQDVEVIEICVAPGDVVSAEQSLIVLESDKASMEIPSPLAGTVVSISVKEGDSVCEGSAILVLETSAVDISNAESTAQAEPQQAEPEQTKPEQNNASRQPDRVSGKKIQQDSVQIAGKAAVSRVEKITVPDIGGGSTVEVIEICVSKGDQLNEGDSLIVLESDKASMEIPSPFAGTVKDLLIEVGQSVSQGDAIVMLETSDATNGDSSVTTNEISSNVALALEHPAAPIELQRSVPELPGMRGQAENHGMPTGIIDNRPSKDVYAGPAVRLMARELGVDLGIVSGSGPKGRIQKEDVQDYVKHALKSRGTAPSLSGAMGIPPIPEVDFSQFGEIRIEKMSKAHRVTASNMHRSWLNIPHVTQFDEVNISDLEDFREAIRDEAQQRGVRVTPLPFLLKACAAALQANASFNASLHADGEQIVYKNYIHIGIAVDTPNGLMVPVIRDVDKKSIWLLAEESAVLAAKAKARKLTADEMKGGCFTISSLGNIGGTGFTPIVNAPEVAILGVSRLSIKPVWNGREFLPEKMLPLCLSYDHRAVNGADAGRFMKTLADVLSDVRRLALL